MSKDKKPPPSTPQVVIPTDGYSAAQRAALLTRMFTTVREDIGMINRFLVARETSAGYMLTHDEAAIASAKLMRAGTAVAALERIFASAMPEGVDMKNLETEARKLSHQASPAAILDSFQDATRNLSLRNKSEPDALVHQG